MFFHLRKVFPLPVCVLCGCLLLRPTQWLNQYKLPSRQWDTTRKCSIIKLNYRQALKETNKYFVTIKLHFFYSCDDWKCLQSMCGMVVAEEEGCRRCCSWLAVNCCTWGNRLGADGRAFSCGVRRATEPQVAPGALLTNSPGAGLRREQSLSLWVRNAAPLWCENTRVNSQMGNEIKALAKPLMTADHQGQTTPI